MGFKKIVLVFLSLLPAAAQAQSDTLSLLFVGDVMQHAAQLDAARTGGGYAYDSCFVYISRYVRQADLALANLETTLAGKPYTGYPAFCSPDELAAALQRAGFGVLLTANNHSVDKGRRGIERTLRVLDSLGIAHTGTFYTALHRELAHPLMVEKNGFRIALLNYTYGTNGIDVPFPAQVNLIDTLRIAADIEKARQQAADIIIANMHWGEEYKLHPSSAQREFARFLSRNGVRLVIGSHPHVLQRMECDEEGVTVYSMGNFVSNMSAPHTDTGAMVSIRLVRAQGKVWVAQCGYRLVWTYKPVVGGKSRFFVLPVADYEDDERFFASGAHFQRMQSAARTARTLLDKENTGFPEYK